MSYVEGIHPVREALRAGRLDRIFLGGRTDRELIELERQARTAGITTIDVDSKHLDRLSVTGRHQGVIGVSEPLRYRDLDDVLSEAGPAPLLVALDSVQDPQNLGAILRVADGAGASGVIVPGRRSAGLGPGTLRASAGAAEYVAVIQITNLVRTLTTLQQRGYWVIGAEADGDRDLYETDLLGSLVVVLGGESRGLGRLVRETCDVVVSIPLRGQLNSLNVATAAAVVLFEAIRQRRTRS